MVTQFLDNALPSFFVMFFVIYISAYFVVFRNWGSINRTEASSCFMSLFHGTPAVIMAVRALLDSQTSRDFASANSPAHERVLEFCTAYFLMDLLHYLVFFPHDILFILHHLATLYVLATCRYVVLHGAYGILLVLVLAEITSPVQNTWSIARFRKVDLPAAAKLYEFLSPRFYVFYSVVRGVLGPICVFKMVVFYVSGGAKGLIPRWAWISWTVVITTAITVSILWVSSHWTNWLRAKSYEAQKKVT